MTLDNLFEKFDFTEEEKEAIVFTVDEAKEKEKEEVAVEFDNKIKRIAEHFEDKISEVKKGVGMTMKATADLNEKIESEVAKVERKIEGKTDETGVINLLNERTKKTNDALANNRKLTSTVEREKKHEIQNANQKAYYDAKKNKTKVNLSAVSHDEGLVM